MQFSSLMLSIAAPAAINTAQSIASVATGMGRSFAQALSGSGSELSPAEAGADPQAESGTFSGRLQALANKLRSWLGDSGVTGPFEINATTAEGATSVDVLGPEAAKIAALVEESPELKQQLKALAASFQSLMGGMSQSARGNGVVSPADVSIRITELNSEARLL